MEFPVCMRLTSSNLTRLLLAASTKCLGLCRQATEDNRTLVPSGCFTSSSNTANCVFLSDFPLSLGVRHIASPHTSGKTFSSAAFSAGRVNNGKIKAKKRTRLFIIYFSCFFWGGKMIGFDNSVSRKASNTEL